MAPTIVEVDDVVVWDDSNDPQHQSEHLYQRHGQRKHDVQHDLSANYDRHDLQGAEVMEQRTHS